MDKTRGNRGSHRADAGHEPVERVHTSVYPVDLGAQKTLLGAPEPMSIEAVLATPNEDLFVVKALCVSS